MYKTLMLKKFQQTFKNPIKFEGIGLHTGKISNVTIFPGENDQGIIFKRVDLKNKNIITANYQNVSAARLCTTLENKDGVKVSTVEHLLAALYIFGIDNAFIEIDNEEVPILDGSSKVFIDLFEKAELRKLSKKRKYLKILDKVELIDGDKSIMIEPSETLKVSFTLNYENKIIGNQKNLVDFHKDNLANIYSSRTFCLFKDIEKIKKNGLAKGGSLDNAIVVDDENILNSKGLRNEKEFVNHKILDLSGDFLLSGYRILGKVTCYQGGHELTNRFLEKLFNTKLAYTSFQIKDPEISKKINSDQTIKIAVNA